MPRMPRTTLDDQVRAEPDANRLAASEGGFRRPFCVQLKLKAAPQPHTAGHNAIIWEECSCPALRLASIRILPGISITETVLFCPIDNQALKKAQSWPIISRMTQGFKTAKIEKSTRRPVRNSGLRGSRAAAPQAIVNQKSRDSSAPVLVSVKFMQLRQSMCRWPIGDPQHFETFRFCGSACPPETSYCKTHNAIAHPSSRPAMTRKTNFQMRARVA
jgi:hypothetical protein